MLPQVKAGQGCVKQNYSHLKILAELGVMPIVLTTTKAEIDWEDGGLRPDQANHL
jgi:hypothetical protein